MKSREGKVHCTWVVAIAECSLNSHNFTPYYSNYTALQCRKTVIFQLLSSRSDKERTDFPHTDVFNQIKLVKVGSAAEIFLFKTFCFINNDQSHIENINIWSGVANVLYSGGFTLARDNNPGDNG